MHAQLTKWGNSAAIRLNKQTLKDTGLALGDTLEVQVTNGSIALVPVKKTETLSDLLSQITPENTHSETDWGQPRGNEIW